MLHARNATETEIAQTGLRHRVYLPQARVGPQPTVLLVHGRAGNCRVMWLFSKALEGQKPITLSPEATLADPAGGYTWWPLFHQNGEESTAPKKTTKADLKVPVAALAQFIRALPELYGTDLQQLYGIGFSQGAALLATMSIQQPKLFRGVALLSGYLPGILHQELDDMPPREPLPSYFIAHGEKDEIIPFCRAEQARDALKKAGAGTTFHADTIGHKVGSSGIKELRSWFEHLVIGDVDDS